MTEFFSMLESMNKVKATLEDLENEVAFFKAQLARVVLENDHLRAENADLRNQLNAVLERC